MFKPDKSQRHVCTSNTLKHLKSGDIFDIQSSKNTTQSFTVLGANIVHKSHPDVACKNGVLSPTTLTLTSNYPFGRRGGDTPLRYVVYAERAR